MNVLIGCRDNHSFPPASPERERWRAGMAIMALPNEWLSLFDVKKSLKAQNTPSRNTPRVTTKCTLAADVFKRVPHYINLGAIKHKGCQHFCLLYQKEIGVHPSFRRKYLQTLEVGHN